MAYAKPWIEYWSRVIVSNSMIKTRILSRNEDDKWWLVEQIQYMSAKMLPSFGLPEEYTGYLDEEWTSNSIYDEQSQNWWHYRRNSNADEWERIL